MALSPLLEQHLRVIFLSLYNSRKWRFLWWLEYTGKIHPKVQLKQTSVEDPTSSSHFSNDIYRGHINIYCLSPRFGKSLIPACCTNSLKAEALLLGALRKTKSLNWNHSPKKKSQKTPKLRRASGRKNGQPKTFSLQNSYPQPASISYENDALFPKDDAGKRRRWGTSWFHPHSTLKLPSLHQCPCHRSWRRLKKKEWRMCSLDLKYTSMKHRFNT